MTEAELMIVLPFTTELPPETRAKLAEGFAKLGSIPVHTRDTSDLCGVIVVRPDLSLITEIISKARCAEKVRAAASDTEEEAAAVLGPTDPGCLKILAHFGSHTIVVDAPIIAIDITPGRQGEPS